MQLRLDRELVERVAALQQSWGFSTQVKTVRRAIFEMATREELIEHDRLLDGISENVKQIAAVFDHLKAAKSWAEAKEQIDDPTVALMINYATTMASATSTLLRRGSAHDSSIGANIN